MGEASPTRRRWWQFSILALLLAVAAIAVMLALTTRPILDERTSAQFTAVSLSDALDYFSSKHGFRYRFVDGAVAAESLSVNETFEELPLREALRRMLEPNGLSYDIENGEIIVSAGNPSRSADWRGSPKDPQH